ncbi:MAG: hypothetical protein CMQ74_02000 [Gammaproteobacteria bacterium]|nr:hypothetical protein [Gammaproteobacteria bacterium]
MIYRYIRIFPIQIPNNKVDQENRIYVDKKLMFNEDWRMKNLNDIKVIQRAIGSEDILLNLLLIYHTGVR